MTVDADLLSRLADRTSMPTSLSLWSKTTIVSDSVWSSIDTALRQDPTKALSQSLIKSAFRSVSVDTILPCPICAASPL